MYMNLKPNKHKISFNTTTMVSLGFIAPLAPLNLAPSPNLIICSGPPPPPPPPNLFLSEIFRSPPKNRAGLLPCNMCITIAF